MRLIRFIKNTFELIRGPKRNFADRVFVLLTAISFIAVITALIGDIIFGESIVEIVVLVGTLIFVPVTTYVGIYFNRIEISVRLIIIGVIFVILPSIFFFGGGLEGGGALWFIFAFLYVGLVLTGRWRTVMLVFVFLMTTVCYLLAYFYPEMVFKHSRSMFYVDSFISMILVGIVCLVMVIFQNRLFKIENEVAKKEAERAEELNRSQNRFFSNMSHEIRTPINSILGLNELILRDPDATEDIIKDANGIAGSGKMLLSLINDILDFSKIEAGSMDLVKVDYSVGDMLSELVNMIWYRAQDKGLEFDVSVDPNVPSVLYGDEVRIKQILINLLNNAVKYTNEGRVGLHIESETLEEDTVLLRFMVTDTGIGIKNDALPYLFDAFKRVDEEKNRHIEGTGLGLSIVKQLLGLMDGEISVNSVYGEGSTFNVVLKQGVVDATGVGDLHIFNYGQANRSIYESSFTAPEAKVLIVDDNEMNLEVEKRLLLGTGMQIDTAGSGKEALERTLSVRYDAILMDHLMPEMDGIKCLELVRRQTGGLNGATPVIVLTANAGAQNKELYTRAGFDGYLVKPVSGEQLEMALINQISPDKLMLRSATERFSRELDTLDGYRKKIPVVVATSSMCDLPDQLMNSPYLPILPFTIITEEGEFKDTYQMESDELLRYIKSGRNAASSPPTVVEYRDFFARNLRNARNLVYIALSTSISEDYNRAVEASKSFGSVYVINSECVSSATGILTLIACKLAQQDITVEEMVSELNTVKDRIRCSFVIDTTEFMAKKGLVPAKVNSVAGSLGIRPWLEFKRDRSFIGGIWMGGRKHAYHRYIKAAFPVDIIPDSEVVFITYVDVPEETLVWIRDEISKIAYFERVIFQKASAAIASNCGPGAFGILYFVKGNKFYNISSILPRTSSEMQYSDKPEEDNGYDSEDAAGTDEAEGSVQENETAVGKAWYEDLEGIDAGTGIENSGSLESFSTVLKLFYEAIDEKAKEIDDYFKNADFKNYTIKVHALKSSAKLVGALALSDEARELEMAGKEGNREFIDEHHEALLAHLLRYKEILGPLYADGEGGSFGDERPVADKELVEKVFALVAKAADEMDSDAIDDALKELSDYVVPEDQRQKYEDVKKLADNFEYDKIVQRLGE